MVKICGGPLVKNLNFIYYDVIFIGCEAQEKGGQVKCVFNRLIILKKSYLQKLVRTTEILHDVISSSKSAFKAAWMKLCTDFCIIVDHSLLDKMFQNAFAGEV